MIAAGTETETFTWWSGSLNFGFWLHSADLTRGKRVNVLRDERGLSLRT